MKRKPEHNSLWYFKCFINSLRSWCNLFLSYSPLFLPPAPFRFTPTSLHHQLCVSFPFNSLSTCVTHKLLDVEPSTGARAAFLGATPLNMNSPSPVHSFSVSFAGAILPPCWNVDGLTFVRVLYRQPQLLRGHGCRRSSVIQNVVQSTSSSGSCSLSGPSSVVFLSHVGIKGKLEFL